MKDMLARIVAIVFFVIAGITALSLSVLIFTLVLFFGIGVAARVWWQQRRLKRNGGGSGMTIESTEYTVIKSETNLSREKDVD